MADIIIMILMACSMAFIIIYNVRYWYESIKATKRRMSKTDSPTIKVPEARRYHGNVSSNYYDQRIVDSIWNKHQHAKFTNISMLNTVGSIQNRSDKSYFLAITGKLPYINLVWLILNHLFVGMLTIAAFIIRFDLNSQLIITSTSLVIGMLSMTYLFLSKYISGKLFGDSDIFTEYDQKYDYVYVLPEDE